MKAGCSAKEGDLDPQVKAKQAAAAGIQDQGLGHCQVQ